VQKKTCRNFIDCHGKRKFLKKETLDVVIEPGMASSQIIVMEMEKMTAAITLRIRKHRTFQRVKNDLIFTREITLKESLFGVPSCFVKTLDCRNLLLKSMKFKTVKPSHAYCIPREGMPIFRENGRRGKLYVKFVVDFPKQLGPEDAMLFERLNGLIKVRSSLASMSIENPVRPSLTSTVIEEESDPVVEHSHENRPYVPLQREMNYLGDLKKRKDLSSTNPDPLVVLNTNMDIIY